MSPRLKHIALYVLAFAAGGLGELTKNTHYAWAAIFLAGVAELRKALGDKPTTPPAAVLALFAACFSVFGCATLKRAEPVAVDCAKQSISTVVQDAVRDPSTDLDGLALSAGVGAVVCAINEYLNTGYALTAALSDADIEARTRDRAWLDKQHVQVK